MGYEIEMSLDLRKHKSVTKIIDGVIEIGVNNECERHYQFSECDGEVRHLKRKAQIIVFCFEDEKFTNMTNFLQSIIRRYKKSINIESIYETSKHNLIYASSFYMTIMEKDQKDNYKTRRANRSFSETDYFILRDILKKNY
jgi:hypothetical protein